MSKSVSVESNARVRVIVRVRPQNAREIANKVAEVVRWPSLDTGADPNSTLSILDPACLQAGVRSDLLKSWSREFAFDRCLWSNTDPAHPLYGTQEDLYQQVGVPVIEWLTTGYNSCVFAFGQTGSGKTYSMMGSLTGSPHQYGLTPRICFSLFEKLSKHAQQMNNESKEGPGGSPADDSFVTLSHMEIYKEMCRDLLTPPRQKAITLRVREHPQKGIFVAGLTHVRVTTFDEVMSLIDIGTKNRTVGATNVNAHSSRSHAIVTLTVVQRARSSQNSISVNKSADIASLSLPTAGMHQKEGRVHLVDLAGSERVALSGAKNTRLKEACSINKSLSVLGDVILSLSTGKRRHIPYRNSTLTLVLKDSLGGNSHAIMVATVSSSSMDYEETISTLKYADRAKLVRMRVDANVTNGLRSASSNSDAATLVPLLQAEVKKLRELLEAQQKAAKEMQDKLELAAQEATLNSLNNSVAVDSDIDADGENIINDDDDDDDELQGMTRQQIWLANKKKHSSLAAAGGGATTTGTARSLSSSNGDYNMRKRVSELEQQLAEREELIVSLEMARMAMAGSSSSAAAVLANNNNDDGSTNISKDRDSGSKRGSSPSSRNSNSNSNFKKNGNGSSSVSVPIPTAVRVKSHTSPSSSSSNGKNLQQSHTSHTHTHTLQSHSHAVLATEAKDTTSPRLINLNQDPLFSECLVYYIPLPLLHHKYKYEGDKYSDIDNNTIANELVTCGSLQDSFVPLAGSDISEVHAVMKCEVIISQHTTDPKAHAANAMDTANGKDRCRIVLYAVSNAHVYVNGHMLATGSSIQQLQDQDQNHTQGHVLEHGDRISFGKYHMFRFESSPVTSICTSSSSNVSTLNTGTDNDNDTSDFIGSASRSSTSSMNWEKAHQELLRALTLSGTTHSDTGSRSSVASVSTVPSSIALNKKEKAQAQEDILSLPPPPPPLGLPLSSKNMNVDTNLQDALDFIDHLDSGSGIFVNNNTPVPVPVSLHIAANGGSEGKGKSIGADELDSYYDYIVSPVKEKQKEKKSTGTGIKTETVIDNMHSHDALKKRSSSKSSTATSTSTFIAPPRDVGPQEWTTPIVSVVPATPDRSTFEEEAQALKNDLTSMQAALAARMARYSAASPLRLP